MDDYEDLEDYEAIYEVPLAKRAGSIDLSKKYNQYFLTPDGYLPTTETNSALPPGAYIVQWDEHRRNVYFKRNVLTCDNLIQFPNSLSLQIKNEINEFWSKKSDFAKAGLVHKRGFLLYGTPGTGKTATINLVAKDTVEAGGIVLIPRVGINGLISSLSKFREVEPERNVVIVFEDIDKIIKADQKEGELLQLLDGACQVGGVVFLATTNQPEILDPSFVNRPSRFDWIVKIPLPDENARRMYLGSFKILTPEDIDVWVKETEDLTVAHIKELFTSVVMFGHGFKNTLERLREMKVVPKQDGIKRIGINV